jgi:adenosine deaminase
LDWRFEEMSRASKLLSTGIKGLPKIDLHRHLLGSARTETLWELSRRYGLIEGRKSLEQFQNLLVHRTPTRGLSEYIRPWKLFREIIQKPEDIRRIAHEAAIDAHRDGVCYVEFRSSLPGMPITDRNGPQTKIPANEYLQAISDAFSTVAGIKCGLVVSIPRHAVGSAKPEMIRKYMARFFDIITNFRNELIVGVDLSGIESGWPAILFKDFFSEARSIGLPITIHAGETEGPEEIWAAIDLLGASRIGHGTTAPKDPVLVRELIQRKIVLEVCPTTGWLSGSLKDRFKHPIINCESPIPYIICTDNPTLNAITLSHELYLAAEISGMEVEAFFHSQLSLASWASFSPQI